MADENLYGYERVDGKNRKLSRRYLTERDSRFGPIVCEYCGAADDGNLTVGHIVPWTFHCLAGLNAPVNNDRSRNRVDVTVLELVNLTYQGMRVGIPENVARAIVDDSTRLPAAVWKAASVKSQMVALATPQIVRYSAQFDLNNLQWECAPCNQGMGTRRLPHSEELARVARARYRTIKWFGN